MRLFPFKQYGIGLILAALCIAVLRWFGLGWPQAQSLFIWLALTLFILLAIGRDPKTSTARPRLLILAILFVSVAMVLPFLGLSQGTTLVFTGALLILLLHAALDLFDARSRRNLLNAGLCIIIVLIGVRNISICSFISCQPAPWSEQIAAAQRAILVSDHDAILEHVYVEVPYPVKFLPGGPPELEVRFSFVSPRRYTDSFDPAYPMVEITLNDRDPSRTVSFQENRSYAGGLPRTSAPWTISDIPIGPREAIDRTLHEGEAYLGHPVGRRNVSLVLYPDGTVAESVAMAHAAWAVSYWDSDRFLTLWVDAQSGAITGRSEQ